MSFDWGELWAHMGLVARMVLATLVFMSLWSAFVIVDRLRRYAAAKAQSVLFGKQAATLLAAREFSKVEAAAAAHDASPLAPVIVSGVKEYLVGLAALEEGADYDVIEASEHAVDRAVEQELARLRQGLGGLASISSSAPFVGLFGTTFGIINSFRAIGLSGQGDLATVAPGIAEALLTTAFGIFVALPAVWFFNYFTGRLEAFSVDLRHAAGETVDYFIKDLGRRAGKKKP